ncbi:mas-related G-protein coupled receptor member H-like [Dendropsophus ebraccatus]|uniref:mas-related G-protein coupled receptor member H-like n=1 Tax=Dendropsophus ebraccatus TaxID=150705 RepID=UPI0038319CC0
MSLNATLTTDLEDEGSYGHSQDTFIHFTTAVAVAILLCLIGLVGNIIVLWNLCLKMKKSTFTAYSINLAVAYFIVLLISVCILILYINTMNNPNPNFEGKDSLFLFLEIVHDSALYSGMFILTAISLERCISVMFPVWHSCHRPKRLSVIMCVTLWSIGCIESLFENLVCTPDTFVTPTSQCTAIQLITFALAIIVCLPIMVTSSIILLIHIKKKFHQQVSTELYAFIIIAVIVFILSVIPFNFLWLLIYFHLIPTDFQTIAFFFASIYAIVINCTIIPYLYIIAEIKWKTKPLRHENDSKTDITTCKTDNI